MTSDSTESHAALVSTVARSRVRGREDRATVGIYSLSTASDGERGDLFGRSAHPLTE